MLKRWLPQAPWLSWDPHLSLEALSVQLFSGGEDSRRVGLRAAPGPCEPSRGRAVWLWAPLKAGLVQGAWYFPVLGFSETLGRF